MIGLGRSVPIEVLPEQVLVRTEEMLVASRENTFRLAATAATILS
jgi:hypothetical protein